MGRHACDGQADLTMELREPGMDFVILQIRNSLGFLGLIRVFVLNLYFLWMN